MINSSHLRKSIAMLIRTGNSPQASAKAVKLIYTTDNVPGITRVKKKDGFEYYSENKPIRNKSILDRIKSLVIPPAWENVWISPDENGHLQATGTDTKQRKQYKYHPNWSSVRNQTKFTNLLEFGKSLPVIRKQLEKDIRQKSNDEKRVLALLIMIMEKTYIRIGSSYYEKLYGSHGLTTMKDKHVKVNGSSLTFMFTGKKGVNHNITLKNKKLANLVKHCRDIPGKELFQYYSNDGIRKKIDSGMVNNYLKSISPNQFTSKDFRTWAGTVIALKKILEYDANEIKPKVTEIISHVSKELGNTPAVCKKYYIHPLILELYENNKIGSLNNAKLKSGKSRMLPEENLLISILAKNEKGNLN